MIRIRILPVFAGIGCAASLWAAASAQPAAAISESKPDAAPPAASVPSTVATSSTTDPAKPMKIGFVDMDVVFQDSKAVQEQIGRVEDRLDATKKEIDRKMSEYSRLRDGLERQDSVLTDEEKTSRRRRIQELKTEVEDLQYEANKQLRQSESGVVEPVLDAVMATVQQIAKREGYDLVLRGEMVLYGVQSIDLTEQLIREIDAKPLVLPPPVPGEEGKTTSDDGDTSPTEPRRRPASAPGASVPLIP